MSTDQGKKLVESLLGLDNELNDYMRNNKNGIYSVSKGRKAVVANILPEISELIDRYNYTKAVTQEDIASLINKLEEHKNDVDTMQNKTDWLAKTGLRRFTSKKEHASHELGAEIASLSSVI